MPPEGVEKYFMERVRFRPGRRPSIPLPFGARSVGYGRASRGCTIDCDPKNLIHVFWGLAGEGVFRIGRQHYVLKPDHVIFYLPGEHHHFRAKDGWSVRWLSIDGRQALQTLISLGLKRRKPWHAGPCPEDQFVTLEQQILDPTPAGERAACTTAFNILIRAADGPPSRGTDCRIVSHGTDLISKHLADTGLCVKWLAGKLSWHRSSFTRAFAAEKGMPPSKYITALRMQKAVQLILSTSIRVAEIARSCGYADPDYFDKVFRKTTGNSPREFRMSRMISSRRS